MEMRITLGTIEGLIEDRKVVHLGRATFRRKNPDSKVLVVNFSNETRLIEMPGEAPLYPLLDGLNHKAFQRNISINFINFVVDFLRKESFYLAEAFYRPSSSWHSYFPFFSDLLEGELYQKCQNF